LRATLACIALYNESSRELEGLRTLLSLSFVSHMESRYLREQFEILASFSPNVYLQNQVVSSSVRLSNLRSTGMSITVRLSVPAESSHWTVESRSIPRVIARSSREGSLIVIAVVYSPSQTAI
jgi:hypothetical protein